MAKIFEFPGVKKPENVKQEKVTGENVIDKMETVNAETKANNVVSILEKKRELADNRMSLSGGNAAGSLKFIQSILEGMDGGGLQIFSRVMTILYQLKQSDPLAFDGRKIEEYKEKYRNYSNEELQNIIKNCDDNYLKTHPNLIHAVVNLLVERDFTMF